MPRRIGRQGYTSEGVLAVPPEWRGEVAARTMTPGTAAGRFFFLSGR